MRMFKRKRAESVESPECTKGARHARKGKAMSHVPICRFIEWIYLNYKS